MTQRKDWTISSLGERVIEAARLKDVTLNGLGRLAGIESGPMSRLSRRTAHTGATPETLRLLAQAAEVSFDWLAFGVGRPELDAPSSGARDQFPHRAEAARIARDGGVDEVAINWVLTQRYELERDPSVLWWIHQIEGRVLLGVPPLGAQPREVALTPVTESGRRPRDHGSTKK